MIRTDGRRNSQLRPVTIGMDYLKDPEGSCLISMGQTRVICAASIQDGVPSFLRGSGSGWITAEYQMLPRSTKTRTPRESTRGRVGGRTHEIQRLIGRSLRAVANLDQLGERTVYIDCDVIQADGGTRTASITGAYAALCRAVRKLEQAGKVPKKCLSGMVAAVSVGIVGGNVLLDLDYQEDSGADVDLNLVMTDKNTFIEVQGTAEKVPFSNMDLDKMLKFGKAGIRKLIQAQKKALK